VRLGYAANNWLFYGKVGGASGTVNLSAVSGPPGAGVTFSQSRQLWGSDFGGGVEYALTRHIILGAEYTSLDHASFNGTASNASAVKVNGKDDFEVQSVVGRLSYKFDWDRDRYVPLK
jgi:opacity protein-like surface antigen